jgi:hypothetical protein
MVVVVPVTDVAVVVVWVYPVVPVPEVWSSVLSDLPLLLPLSPSSNLLPPPWGQPPAPGPTTMGCLLVVIASCCARMNSSCCFMTSGEGYDIGAAPARGTADGYTAGLVATRLLIMLKASLRGATDTGGFMCCPEWMAVDLGVCTVGTGGLSDLIVSAPPG